MPHWSLSNNWLISRCVTHCLLSIILLGPFANLRKGLLLVSLCLSVRSRVRMDLGSLWKDFHEICYLFFEKKVEKFQVSLKSHKNNGYFTWRPLHIFFFISRSFLLRMRNVSGKSCWENQNTSFFVQKLFFFENRAVYEIMWKNCVERDRLQITTWDTSIACRITKATHIQSQYVALTAFPLQQWFQERASMLR